MKFKTLEMSCINSMYNILIDNLSSINSNFIEKDDDYENWENYCKDNEVIVLYENRKVYAFLMYRENNILEVQIDKNHQGDKVTFRTLIKKYLENITEYEKIGCYLYPYHKKALEIFTSIGFVFKETNYYEINFDMLKSWAYRR